jgi:hypothetical protein
MRRPTLFVAFALMAFTVRPSLSQTQPPAPAAPAAAAPAPDANQVNLGNDPNGNQLRRALRTGHISNYDETKVPPYTLPDPLVMANGRRVTDANTWRRQRRPELIRLYENEIYGRVPANAPRVTWEVTETDTHARDGAAVLKKVVGHVGMKTDGPQIRVSVYTPANTAAKVPIILLVNFGGGQGSVGGPPAGPAPPNGAGTAAGRAGAGRGNAVTGEPPNAADILARGWGYATVGYNDIQPDRNNAWSEGVIGQTLAPGQTKPAIGEWGTISAWAWGASRIADYLQSDPNVDGTHIALYGFSRLGKTVLWAAAQDERFQVVFSGCAGEMGSALARRDWGETVDDMAQNYAWQFGGRFQLWPGRWAEMPVDAHMLISLIAPRPLFVTGGTGDQWSDPKGEFLSQVAAGPVYRLLGARDLGVTTYPAPDTPIVTGDLGFNLHTGPHTATPAEWATFVDFLARYFPSTKSGAAR